MAKQQLQHKIKQSKPSNWQSLENPKKLTNRKIVSPPLLNNNTISYKNCDKTDAQANNVEAVHHNNVNHNSKFLINKINNKNNTYFQQNTSILKHKDFTNPKEII